MARDYKHAGKKAPPTTRKKPAATSSAPKAELPKNGMSAGMALFIGLAIGLGVAGYVYFQLKPQSQQPEQAVAPAPQLEVKPKQSAAKAEPEEEPRFDFYSILPKLEVIIPESEIRGDEKPAASNRRSTEAPAAVEKPGSYLLQAGSFRNGKDAERLKAELALLGVQSNIETVTINDSDTWHRVRIGPYSDTKQLNKIRNRLLDNGVDVMVLRVKS